VYQSSRPTWPGFEVREERHREIAVRVHRHSAGSVAIAAPKRIATQEIGATQMKSHTSAKCDRLMCPPTSSEIPAQNQHHKIRRGRDSNSCKKPKPISRGRSRHCSSETEEPYLEAMSITVRWQRCFSAFFRVLATSHLNIRRRISGRLEQCRQSAYADYRVTKSRSPQHASRSVSEIIVGTAGFVRTFPMSRPIKPRKDTDYKI